MLHEFLYLFLTDLVRTPFHDYKSYTEEEPNYGSSMLRAYITAFNKQTNGLMSEELIQAIHKDAMSFSSNSNPGQYKNDFNNLDLYPYEMTAGFNLAYSASNEGIKEFLEFWFKNTAEPFHDFSFDNHDGSTANIYNFSPKPNGIMLLATDLQSKKIQPKLISFEMASQLIYKLMEQSEKKCIIGFFSNNKKEDIQQLTSQKMKKIINEFNTEILKAQTSDEKITCIAKHIQRIDQVHPFKDGNIRTCYILMNKLLKDHGLSLTILMNPNRLDACSLQEIVKMIKQGQIHYQQLIQHKEGNLKLSAPDELSKDSQLITCLPQKIDDIPTLLLENFIGSVIEGKPQQLNSTTNNPYVFLPAVKETSKELIEKLSSLINFKFEKNKALLKALEEKKYNLVLRQVCAHYNLNVINEVLKYHDQCFFDPSEPSSTGKTAFDWLEGNKNLNLEQKDLIKNRLLSFKAKNLESNSMEILI